MILVTGGAGYIGSHTVLTLLQHGHDVLVLDNLCNSSAESIRRVNRLTGKNARLIEGDIRDRALLDQILGEHPIRAVIHFAGLKAVGESVQKPLAYYDNNVGGSITLIEAMQAAGVKNLVFSSSATVYGEQGGIREYIETMPLGVPSSPYGKTKVMIETILGDTAHADPAWTIALLRYFNPVGAHESGDIGEDPMATTTTPLMAPACVTTSMSWISLPVTSKRWNTLRTKPACTPGTSAAAQAARCSTSSVPTKKPAAKPFPTPSRRAAPVTCPPSGPTRKKPHANSAGAPNVAWMT